jgi:hypothetical protein
MKVGRPPAPGILPLSSAAFALPAISFMQHKCRITITLDPSKLHYSKAYIYTHTHTHTHTICEPINETIKLITRTNAVLITPVKRKIVNEGLNEGNQSKWHSLFAALHRLAMIII